VQYVPQCVIHDQAGGLRRFRGAFDLAFTAWQTAAKLALEQVKLVFQVGDALLVLLHPVTLD
jgi:hypothetical protein